MPSSRVSGVTPSSPAAPSRVTPVGAGGRQHLVEDRQAVARGAGGGADDQRQDARVDGDALRRDDRAQQLGERPRRHEPERVVVGARPDGLQHALRLGRREDELHELRRLLDELQQRVERRRRDHVGLVDDVDLVAARHGREEGPFAQVTGVVDAVVRRRVDLDDVERAGAVRGQRDARGAGAARVGRRALLAVQRARHDAGARGLAAAARAAEQVGVRDAAVRQRLAQRAGDVRLPDDLGERARPVLAVERQAHARASCARSDEGPPAHPPRACLPLLPSGPGGVQRDGRRTRGLPTTLPAGALSRGRSPRLASAPHHPGGFA